jgi:alpha-L-fucosidase
MNNKRSKGVIGLVMVCLLIPFFFVRPIKADVTQETEKQREERMKWWTEARFGMFIHWGLYAMPSRGVWSMSRESVTEENYQKYYELFDPDLFDPREWAHVAKEAGMKYFVITTKHHEGFCLWDSKYTDFKVTKTPYGKDLIKPMLKAFRDEGIRVGFYYSLLDWHHADYPVDRRHPMRDNKEFREKTKNRDIRKYAEYVHNQVRELLTDFGQIDCLFMDFSFPGEDGKGRDDWQSEKLLGMIRKLQPNIIINDRLDLLDMPGGWDYRTPEQFKPRDWIKIDGKRVPWETCQTFSGHWGYDRDEATWKSTRQLLVLLIETVSKGGNLLLNVGPTARGTFDDRAMNRLKEIGEWMKLNSRSIYGCTQAPENFKTPENCLLTYDPSKNRLYVHVLDWPMGKLYLEGFADKVKYAQLLHDASEITFVPPRRSSVTIEETVSENTLILGLPILKPDVTVPVIELFLK